MLVKMRKIFTSEQQLYYQLHRILEVSYRDPAISLLTENIIYLFFIFVPF